ncbi:MAG: PhoH family protein, partial [Bradymonadaceae bacterium]
VFTEAWTESPSPELQRATDIPKDGNLDNLEKAKENVEELSDVRLLVHTQPTEAGIGKKTPENFEIGIGGTVEEKLAPWMKPIYDNVEYLMGLSQADKRAGRGADELRDMGIIEVEPLTYIRGRSLPNQFMIVDEAQNLTPHEVKTVMTRVGENTKIVLTGDPYQIDNPYVDSESNGLTYVVNKFKEEPIAATISLFKGERSELAEKAANLL